MTNSAKVNPIRPGERGEVPTPISTFENFLHILISNTYQMWPLLLKFIGEQDFGKILVKGITCCHGSPVFDAMFTQILTF